MMKSGTTAIFSSLSKHPQIVVSKKKELNHYYYKNKEEESVKPIDNYIKAFNQASNYKIRIDFSPKYMLRPESAHLIYETNPSTKFIILLRNPITRSYSHFRYQEKLFNFFDDGSCSNRTKMITFKQYIAEEYKILSQCGLINWNIDFPLVSF